MMVGDGAIQAAAGKPARHGAESPSAASVPKMARAWVSMEDLVGAELVQSLRLRLAKVDSITAKFVQAIDDEFHITKSHGVPRRRLKVLLRRLRRRANDSAGEPRASGHVLKPAGKHGQGADWDKKLGRHRRRQASVASILDSVFGRFADCDPQLWERRAYLMVVGMVYERLATSEKDLSDESLLKLAKALAQQRRIRGTAIKKKRSDEKKTAVDGDSAGGPVSKRFAKLIREVYGTGVQDGD